MNQLRTITLTVDLISSSNYLSPYRNRKVSAISKSKLTGLHNPIFVSRMIIADSTIDMVMTSTIYGLELNIKTGSVHLI